MKRFEMTFRTYLEEHRDQRHLVKLLLMVSEGISELHNIDFVHRDLKPENIGISLKPLYACVFDFDRALPRS